MKTLTNSNELRAALTRKGMTQEQVAEALGITTATLNYKINNKREFKTSEVKALVDLLEIKKEDIDKIFFANDVDCESTFEETEGE